MRNQRDMIIHNQSYLAPADENSERTEISSNQCHNNDNILVTDFVPSAIACLASSPGRISLTEVWISREEMVDFFEYAASSGKEREKNASEDQNLTIVDTLDILDASVAIRSKISLTKLLRMAIALLEIPVSGWTCLRTKKTISDKVQPRPHAKKLTLVDIRRVRLFSDLLSLLLLTIGRRCSLRGLLSCLRTFCGFGWGLGCSSGGFASSRCRFRCHSL